MGTELRVPMLEKIIAIDPSEPAWWQMEKFQEARSLFRVRRVRGIMLFMPEKRGCVDDRGAEMRGFIVHEMGMRKNVMPPEAHWFVLAHPMTDAEIESHLQQHGSNGYPFIFTTDGQVFTKTELRVLEEA